MEGRGFGIRPVPRFRVSDDRPGIHDTGEVRFYHGHKRDPGPSVWNLLLSEPAFIRSCSGCFYRFCRSFLPDPSRQSGQDQPGRRADPGVCGGLRGPDSARRTVLAAGPYFFADRFSISGTAAWSLPLALLYAGPVLRGSGWSLSLSVGYLALFCTAIAFSVQIHAQKRVSAARAALIFSLEPVFAALASTLFYGEDLTWLEWMGGFLVVSGVIVGEFSVLRSKTGTAG